MAKRKAAKRTASKRTASKGKAGMTRRVAVRFERTKSKRVRFRATQPGRPAIWSQSYASPQGARRAAKRRFKGQTIFWGS